MQILEGVRVLEVGQMVAVPYATKLLADLGATVIKVEPPGGDRSRLHGPFPPHAPADPEQSGLFLGLNTNKQSTVVDVDTPSGRQRLSELVASADIVIHDLSQTGAKAAGLDADSLLERFPTLVVCAVTPYGQTGPHAEWLGEELQVVHGGGWGYLIPGDDPDLELAPLTVYGHPAHCQAGMAAAFAALGAYFKVRRGGVGDHIDLSVMSHVASMLEASFIAWSYMGVVPTRAEGRLLNPWGIYPCRDGLIFLVTVEQDQWERLVEMMGNPEWALLEVFATFDDRAANRDLLDIYIEEWTTQHDVEELFHEGQRRRICFAPVFTMNDLERQDHLAERGFFVPVEHESAGELTHMGAPFVMSPPTWQLHTAAPRLDQHADTTFEDTTPRRLEIDPVADGVAVGATSRPLEGLRVVDFSWVWAGPFSTMHLAYLGAEVIKIESTARPSLGRRLPIHPPDVEPSLNTGGYFNQWDQGKKSVELDLTDPAAIETALRLVATADVVVDNYATGVMERLGLSDDVLRQANPDIIIASVTGYGHTGPLAEYMGYGPTTAPLSGLASMTGRVGGKPEEAGISFGDPAAGLTAAFAVMAAIVGRAQGAGPGRIDVALWESTATNAIELWMGHVLGAETPERMGNRSPAAAPRGVFRCRGDDAWIAISCTSDEQWQRLAELLGGPATESRFGTLAGRKRDEAELEALIEQFTREQDSWPLTERLQAAGIAAYPSLSCEAIGVNPQLVERGFWERFDHPEVGARAHSGVPWRNRNTVNGGVGRAPLLGEHTTEILAQLDAPADR